MAAIQLLITLLVFSVIHSILARLPVKSWFRGIVAERFFEGFYRIWYNFVSVITFLPVILVLVFQPGTMVWNLPTAPALLFRLLQLIGIIGLGLSLYQIDLGRFVGTAQVRAYLTDNILPLPPEQLQTGGIYAVVRHPLYFFSMLVLWFTPTMTSSGLTFCIGVTAYFVIGSFFEERTMLKVFGDDYQQYQRQVPWMIPFLV